VTTVSQWQEGMGLGRRSTEDVPLGYVTDKFVFTVMLGVSFIVKMHC